MIGLAYYSRKIAFKAEKSLHFTDTQFKGTTRLRVTIGEESWSKDIRNHIIKLDVVRQNSSPGSIVERTGCRLQRSATPSNAGCDRGFLETLMIASYCFDDDNFTHYSSPPRWQPLKGNTDSNLLFRCSTEESDFMVQLQLVQ